MNHVKS